MLATNLRIIGRRPITRSRAALEYRRPHEGIRPLTEQIVKSAIRHECPRDLAEKAIHGYRRSDGSEEAAEEHFQKTDQPEFHIKRDYHYRRALRVTEKLFRPSRRLKPISFPDLRYYPWTVNVSAERPYTQNDYWIEYLKQRQSDGVNENARPSFHNLYDEIFHINRKHIHTIKEGLRPFWNAKGEPVPYEYTSLHTRAHLVETNDPDKNRAVFGVPKLLLMAENMFIWNLQKEYLNRNVDSPMLWGYETARGGWMKIFNKLKINDTSSILSTDWSQFDSRALHEVIDDVHLMWRSWFDFDSGYEPSVSDDFDYSDTATEERRIQRLWDWMTNAIKHTPIEGSSGTRYQWTFNGIASGFQQTQLLDSFVNTIYILTCLSALGINIEADSFTILVQGDDSLVSFGEHVFDIKPKDFIKSLAAEAMLRFNAILSESKTTYGTSLNGISVLGYSNDQGMATRPEAELLAKLLFPERPRNLETLAAAAVGIAVAAMGSSRNVYNTCKNVYDFLTVNLEITPRLDPNLRYDVLSQMTLDYFEDKFLGVRFPTFEETLAQNFDWNSRSDSEKQKLWPTIGKGNNFRFLQT